MKVVHFGAGNIGRGFIGQVLHENGFDICFIDTSQELINQLNNDQGYTIEYLDHENSTFFIDRVEAINSITETERVYEAIEGADLITTSVGANNLDKIAPTLAKALVQRFEKSEHPINILANENIINASSLLEKEIYKNVEEKKDLLNQFTSFVNTAIDRQALSKTIDGKNIAVVEPYYEWVISETEWRDDTGVALEHVTFVSDMQPFIERKLFIVNAAHAAFAYLGALFNYKTVQEAMADEKIVEIVNGFLFENSQYFIRKYHSNPEELNSFIKNTLKRHGNEQLSDSVDRVGRSPIRKLNASDRLVGPVNQLAALDLPYINGSKVIAAAYLYRNFDDQEAVKIKQLVDTKDFNDVLLMVSGIKGNLASDLTTVFNLANKDKMTLIGE